MVLALCACRRDEVIVAPPAPTHRLEMNVPVRVYLNNGADSGTKGYGDPGKSDDIYATPRNLYLFSWIEVPGTGSKTYQFYFAKREGLTADDWITWGQENTSTARYELKKPITLLLNVKNDQYSSYTKGTSVGQTYAIATVEKTFSSDELASIMNFISDNGSTFTYDNAKLIEIDDVNRHYNTHYFKVDELSSNPKDKIQTLEIDCSNTTNWPSAKLQDYLRDLYSTPLGDDGKAYDHANGEIYYEPGISGSNTGAVTHAAVRLYHAAAKIDFKWEVASVLQPTTAINSITVKSLPTLCKIFKPTENPTTNTTVYTIGSGSDANIPIVAGNQWIGREYFYALQPAGGAIDYTVTFKALNGSTARAGINTTFTPVAVSDVFTGWYRILATVNP